MLYDPLAVRTLNIKAVETRKIKQYLSEKYELPDYKARMCAAFAQGNVGKAVRLATSEGFNEIYPGCAPFSEVYR